MSKLLQRMFGVFKLKVQGSTAITAMAKKQFDEVITDFLKEDDKTSVPSKPKAGISQNKYIKSPASSLNTSRNSINQKYKNNGKAK